MTADREYVRKKKRKKKKRRKKRYLLKFCLFILFCFGAYQFLTSSFFDIHSIEVENNQYYTKEQVIAMAGIQTGGNLFQTSLKEAKEVLLADPYIRTVKVSRKLPGKVQIRLDERTEYAAIPHDGLYVLIDRDGMVLRLTEFEPALTLLEGMTMHLFEPGQPLEVEEGFLLTDTLNMLEVIDEHDLYFKKISISQVVIRAYVNDNLICEGTPENILNNLDKLQISIYERYLSEVERGTIKVSSDDVFFSPEIN